MTPDLPEDLSAWPSQPDKLLGITDQTTATELKRRYTSLIRKFKPERFPDHFRRIREAYEQSLPMIQWRDQRRQYAPPVVSSPGTPPESRAGGEDAAASATPLSAIAPTEPSEVLNPDEANDKIPGATGAKTAAESPATQDSGLDARNTLPPANPLAAEMAPTADRESILATPRAPAASPWLNPGDAGWEDGLEQVWNQARRGDVAGAYHRLCQWESRHRGNGPLCTRLYWLLSIHPELDKNREPLEWLIAALRANGLSGANWELYRRELERRPAEIGTPRCEEIWQFAATPGALASFAHWRWSAAVSLNNIEIIINDLDRLYTVLAADHADLWAQLLMRGVGIMAWRTEDSARHASEVCFAELEKLGDLYHRQSDLFEELDWLRTVLPAWQKLRHAEFPPALVDFLASCWYLEPHLLEQLALRHFQQMLAYTDNTLALFDNLNYIAPETIHLLRRALRSCDRFGGERPAPEDSDYLLDLFAAHFKDHARINYAACRRWILNFCLHERVGPQDLATLLMCDANPPGWLVELADQLSQDHSLNYLYLIHVVLAD
ncbi:MAG: hypothetical protein SFX18_18640 [Pirellulales bacterium]|nr:hypothetical protein [Pirellulales bacterium]